MNAPSPDSPRSGTPARPFPLFRRFPFEAAVWIAGFGFLALIDPGAGNLPDFCLLHTFGITWCPGCGLGRSVAYLLDGSIGPSLATHPLGVPALLLLGWRTFRLLHTWARSGPLTMHSP